MSLQLWRVDGGKCFSFGNVDGFLHTVEDVDSPAVLVVHRHKAAFSANVEHEIMAFIGALHPHFHQHLAGFDVVLDARCTDRIVQQTFHTRTIIQHEKREKFNSEVYDLSALTIASGADDDFGVMWNLGV